MKIHHGIEKDPFHNITSAPERSSQISQTIPSLDLLTATDAPAHPTQLHPEDVSSILATFPTLSPPSSSTPIPLI